MSATTATSPGWTKPRPASATATSSSTPGAGVIARRPPPISDDNPWNPNRDPRYGHLPPELIPKSECLADVVERLMPYWYDDVIPDLRVGRIVLISAHGNSLRALAKHLDQIDDRSIAALNIPTGMPLVYELGGRHDAPGSQNDARPLAQPRRGGRSSRGGGQASGAERLRARGQWAVGVHPTDTEVSGP